MSIRSEIDRINAEVAAQAEQIALARATLAGKGGTVIPELLNPGTAADLLQGKQMIDKYGMAMDGEIPVLDGGMVTVTNELQTVVPAGSYVLKDVVVPGYASFEEVAY